VSELVNDEQTGLDLVQETFVAAIRHIDSLREDDKFGSWLFGIAHQKCIQHWRNTGREQLLDEELLETLPGADNDPAELLIREEQEVDFMQALSQLPVSQRSVLVLHFLEDFSLEEIARITGTNLGTVKSRLHYAKKALRKLLDGKL